MSAPAVGVVIKVPATSANLGPGFDSLGLALGVHDIVEADARFDDVSTETAVAVAVDGVGAADVPLDGRHLVARSMLACFAELGVKPSSLRLRCHNAIPHARGLGSSAAAIVAGVLAARALAGAAECADDTLALAARLEGHPDNVAPCLLGGFTIAWTGGGVSRAVSADPHPDLQPIVCIPSVAVSTETARGLLPATVPHQDAARTAGRAALLVEAVTRRPDLLFDATEDWLHQMYRQPAMPASIALVSALRERQLPAVVSGAGPSVLVLTTGDKAGLVRSVATGWDVRVLPVDRGGATIGLREPRG